MSTISSCFKSLFILIFLSASQNMFGQVNFQPGQIIQLDGVTKEGFVDVRYWRKNPKEITFKESEKSASTSYNPLEIKGFKVDKSLYRGAIVEARINSTNIDQLKEKSEIETQTDTIFLETFYKGNKSLFFYKDLNGLENFYIINSEEELELLYYNKYLAAVDDPNDLSIDAKKSSIKENKQYIKQLSFYLKDCKTINTKIQGLKYTKKSISELFKYYYNCSSTRPEFLKTIEKFSFDFGFILGGNLTTLNYNSSGFDNIVGTKFKNTYNFTGGISFDIIFPRTQKRWSLNNELFFSSYKTEGQYLDFINDQRFTLSNNEVGYSYIKLNNQVRFKYPIKSAFLFTNFGISNGYAFNETNYQLKETTFFSTFRTEEGEAVEKAKKYEQGVIFGIGALYKKFSLECRYEGSTGNSPVNTLSSEVKRYSLLVGYYF